MTRSECYSAHVSVQPKDANVGHRAKRGDRGCPPCLNSFEWKIGGNQSLRLTFEATLCLQLTDNALTGTQRNACQFLVCRRTVKVGS